MLKDGVSECAFPISPKYPLLQPCTWSLGVRCSIVLPKQILSLSLRLKCLKLSKNNNNNNRLPLSQAHKDRLCAQPSCAHPTLAHSYGATC